MDIENTTGDTGFHRSTFHSWSRSVLTLRERASQTRQSVTFTGWTNTGGVENAVFVFPLPAQSRPKHNFLLKRTFRFEVKVLFHHENGRTNRGTIVNGFGSGFPVGLTEVLVPVSSSVRSFTVLRAEGVVGGYWDNAFLGWKPSSHPTEKRWTFIASDVVEIAAPK